MKNDNSEERNIHSVITQQYVTETKQILAYNMRHSMTEPEKKLWGMLRANGLGVHFRRQQVIDGFIADFFAHSIKLAIEIDGCIHNKSEISAYDKERDRIISERNITILRFTNDEIMFDMSNVLLKLKSTISNLKS